MIYLDNITTTKPSQAAIFAMLPFFQEAYGSVLQPHQMGQELIPSLEKYYRSLYALLLAKESDTFVFTSSGAESISQVIHSVYRTVVRQTGKNHFVTSPLEEAATVYAITKLNDDGVVLQMAKATPSGKVSLDTISEAITPRTALISLSWACALTGVVQPVREIAALCKQRGILFHVDVTHALGKLYGNIDDIGANYTTFNGEQLHAPKGTGGLFVRGAGICSLISGEDEGTRYRGGPLNVALLASLAQAAVEAEQSKNLYCTEVARLRDKLERGITAIYPDAICLFQDEERLPHISVMSFPGIRNEALLFALNQKKLFASMGGGQFQSIDRILEACSVDHATAQCALTFSLSKDTTDADIDRAVEIIADTAKRLKRLSRALI